MSLARPVGAPAAVGVLILHDITRKDAPKKELYFTTQLLVELFIMFIWPCPLGSRTFGMDPAQWQQDPAAMLCTSLSNRGHRLREINPKAPLDLFC